MTVLEGDFWNVCTPLFDDEAVGGRLRAAINVLEVVSLPCVCSQASRKSDPPWYGC